MKVEMKLKRLVSIFLLSCFLLSFCPFSVYADDLHADDFSVLLGRQTNNSAGGTTTDYFTFTTESLKSNGIQCNYYKPVNYSGFWPQGATKIISAFQSPSLIAGHEYQLSFATGVNFNAKTKIEVYLNSTLIYSDTINGTGAKKISINFKAPDFATSDTSIRIECSIGEGYGYGAAGQNAGFLLSKNIGFNDNTDNPGWLGKILEKFTALGDRIGSFFTNLSDNISEFFNSLGDRISGFFTDLKDNLTEKFNNLKQWFIGLGDSIGEFFEMLKNYLLYFQHPVTLDKDGVPVGADGNPVYTNPFASKIEQFKETVNGWLQQIKDFVAQIDNSAESVSSYIKNGSSIVSGVLTAVPILTAVLTFALVLLVVRKVVGR